MVKEKGGQYRNVEAPCSSTYKL